MGAATATATATVAVAGVLLATACGPEAGAARRARLEAQREHLVAALDSLEARILEGKARVRGWEELRERHARVSAVACQVNGRHVADMARLEEEERWLAAGRRAPRLAAALAAPAPLGRGGGRPLEEPGPVAPVGAASSPPVDAAGAAPEASGD